MNPLNNRIRQKKEELTGPHGLFRNETGAIDLASIMVGIIVIGLIGGVIASTVFVVIPWTQDNAAKQQLGSVVSAESAYFGLSAATPSPLPVGYKANTFGNSAELKAANLLSTGTTYCVSTPADGKTYTAFSQSPSGKVWSATDKISKPVIYTGTLPTDCQFITEGVAATPSTPTAEYVDPTPTLTILTYKCNSAVTGGSLPIFGVISGTETWSDAPGTPKVYTPTAYPASRNFAAGVEYKVTFNGTYTKISYNATAEAQKLAPCLRSVDHWGSDVGVTNAKAGFAQSPFLTSVPDHVPTTITDMTYLFWGDPLLNDPNISNWDVSNVTTMYGMFNNAVTFNQPLNDWDISNVTNTKYMFMNAPKFNQPLEKWDVSKVADMSYMFAFATDFDKNLSTWNTSAVTIPTYANYFAPNTFNINFLPPKTTRQL